MNDDQPKIPTVASVPQGVPRPRWSVMIPSYNAAATIGETLASILAQAPSADAMQIAVLDNDSTDDTLAVVERAAASYAPGRVEITRHPTNFGMLANWNACLERSRGEFVQILHADDYLRPGFFDAVDRAFAQKSDARICVARSLVVDDKGELVGLDRRLGSTGASLHVGVLAYGNEFYPPGIVVRRSIYERVGGFSSGWFHLADWELWTRILVDGQGVYVNEPLACYRVWGGNASKQLSRTAADLRELIRFTDVLSRRIPGFDRRIWRRFIRDHAEGAALNWQRAGEASAAAANFACWREVASVGERLDSTLAALKGSLKACERTVRRTLRPSKYR